MSNCETPQDYVPLCIVDDCCRLKRGSSRALKAHLHMLAVARSTCQVITNKLSLLFPISLAVPQPLLPMSGITKPSASPADNTATQQSQLQNSTSLKQENQYVELDFASNMPNLIHARGDKTLYWSNSHKELSHHDLFIRAARTRTRLIPDLKNTLVKLSYSMKRQIHNKGRLIHDLEPPERRYDLRLTGKVSANYGDWILMTGWVWIQCGDIYSVRKIKKRLAELQWLKGNAYAPVHVYLEPIVA